tara:strand:+ start:1343 stop:1645 length:303 start_codon:yes stop_codon:yes gene_type:complete
VCDLDDGSDGYGTSFGDKIIGAARKQHRCCECPRPIKVGDSYCIVSGTWEGDFYTNKVCLRCRRASKWLMSRGHAWRSGEVIADVRYCVEQNLLEKKNAN